MRRNSVVVFQQPFLCHFISPDSPSVRNTPVHQVEVESGRNTPVQQVEVESGRNTPVQQVEVESERYTPVQQVEVESPLVANLLNSFHLK